MDESLFRRAKLAAAGEGRPLSAVLEDALQRYLDGPRDASTDRSLSVGETWGAFALPSATVQQIMEEDDEYADD